MSRVLLLLVFCAINAMRLLWNHYFISLYFTIYFSISLHIPAMPLLLPPLNNVSHLIYISHIDVYHRHRLSTVWHVPTEQPTLFFINVLFSLFCFVSVCIVRFILFSNVIAVTTAEAAALATNEKREKTTQTRTNLFSNLT